MALTDPTNYAGEIYNTNEMKIDQLKKFLSAYAFNRAEKKEKVLEFHHLTLTSSQNQNTGICGRKTGNICLIVFADYNFFVNFHEYEFLVEHFKNDPVTLTYVDGEVEVQMKLQFGINNLGAVLYKPKKAKYIALKDDELPNGFTPKALKKLVEDALTGGTGKWEKVVNDNNNGLLFKEFVDKRK